MQKIVESVFYCPLVSDNIRYMQFELSLFLSAQSGIKGNVSSMFTATSSIVQNILSALLLVACALN